MTEPNAFEVTVNVKTGMISLMLIGQHREKWNNIMNIAETQNKNWNKAWGVGVQELGMVINNMRRWVQNLGVKLK